MITGSPAPIFRPMGNSCNRVAIPAMNRADCTSSVVWAASKLATPLPAITRDGVTQPTIMATTCCKAKGNACRMGGKPCQEKIRVRFS